MMEDKISPKEVLKEELEDQKPQERSRTTQSQVHRPTFKEESREMTEGEWNGA